ncbi:MAG: hypothetical protein IJB11_05530 [Oscillospiraceae bacterium]|nr:hypothetical protein [Oscillospiraceae bacterium]
MSIQRIAEILTLHSIPYRIEEGHIYADTMSAGSGLLEEVEDLTGYRYHQLMAWLGY